MKSFFFAIIFLAFLIPLSAHAEIEKGINYDRGLIQVKPNGDQVYKWTSTPNSIDRVFDGTQWTDRKIQNNGTHFNVYSNLGSFSFDKNDCTITQYTKGFDPTTQTAHRSNVIIGDWFWTIARKNGANPWQVLDPMIFDCAISTSQNSTGKYLTMTRTHVATGSYLKVTLAAQNDRPMEDFNELYMNVPAWNGNKFAFVLWAKDVNTNSITYRNGTTIQIPSGQTIIDRSQLTVNSLDFVKNGNGFYFDWAKALPYFKTLILNKTGSVLDVQFGFNNNAPTLNTGQKMFLDPTYAYTAAQSQQTIISGPVAGASCGAGTSNATAAAGSYQSYLASTANDNCVLQVGKWIVTSIPDGVTINSANFRHDRGVLGGSVNEIKLVSHNMTSDPQGSASAATKWTQATGGNFIISPWTESVAGTNDIVRPFNSNGTTYIRNQLPYNWVGISVTSVSQTRDAAAHIIQNMQNWELEVTYTLTAPSPITTLAASGTTDSTTNLSWTAPALGGGTLQRYQLNYTTPCGTPLTALPNGTTATSYVVSGLTPATCYSFRATAATELGRNVVGANIVNVTTLAFNEANYTIGYFSYNANNPILLPIRYERINNGTQTYVNVTFAKTISLACDLRYTYAGTNHTYHTIPYITISGTERESQFRFTNSSNDITTFRCWDQTGNQSANYVLTQTNFLLLQQIHDFRNGTYGTQGQLGAFDFITLIIVILAMIGLNRTNEAVAGFFCIVAVSVMTYFGIIQWYIALLSALAVIIMLGISSTRKD